MGIYKPGFRNIGSFETKIRYAVGFGGFAILAIEIFLVFFYKAAPVYISPFLPLKRYFTVFLYSESSLFII